MNEILSLVPEFMEISNKVNWSLPDTFYSSLSERQKCIAMIVSMDTEINNGGVGQYVINPSGRYIRRTVDIASKMKCYVLVNFLEGILSEIPEIEKCNELIGRNRFDMLLPCELNKRDYLRAQNRVYESIRETVIDNTIAYCESL